MTETTVRPILGVETLTLDHFRNYESLTLSLGRGIHILAGQNAQGKTNLLESLYLASTTRLLRGIRDSEAIMEGGSRATVKVSLLDTHTEIQVILDRGIKKRVLLNGMNLPRASDILGRLPCVCISSADLPIVSGEPSDRRMFLDLQLSQLYPAYLRHLAVYKRALEQRNALVKAARDNWVGPETFEAWEAQLASEGASLREYRVRFLEDLRPFAKEAQSEMGGGESIELDYQPKDESVTEEELATALQQSRGQDISRGTTSVGPHRDDFLMRVDAREARLYGSQGQQRTTAVCLKLATVEHEKTLRGEAPLLLLDDVLSDLDEGRRARLMVWVLEHAGQTILTCTEPEAAGKSILAKAALFRVHAGQVTEA